MARKFVRPRVPWEDRFQAPEAGDLIGVMPRHLGSLVQHAREGLMSLGGVSEAVVWRGVPWRWTLTFADEGEPERPWAYLVPQPTKPVLAIPLSVQVVQSLPVKRMSKGVRDGIALAAQVAGVFWAQWELTSKAQVGELLMIAKRRRECELSATV
jgi:hypothetical protein